mmetsp:Transcript_114099/g.363775  ORF Transcript_114099/g.363775 Transcript_114099/m.363775 type:complete len:351 (-) Transcript_114099:472-1524(-)
MSRKASQALKMWKVARSMDTSHSASWRGGQKSCMTGSAAECRHTSGSARGCRRAEAQKLARPSLYNRPRGRHCQLSSETCSPAASRLETCAMSKCRPSEVLCAALLEPGPRCLLPARLPAALAMDTQSGLTPDRQSSKTHRLARTTAFRMVPRTCLSTQESTSSIGHRVAGRRGSIRSGTRPPEKVRMSPACTAFARRVYSAPIISRACSSLPTTSFANTRARCTSSDRAIMVVTPRGQAKGVEVLLTIASIPWPSTHASPAIGYNHPRSPCAHSSDWSASRQRSRPAGDSCPKPLATRTSSSCLRARQRPPSARSQFRSGKASSTPGTLALPPCPGEAKCGTAASGGDQ